MNFKANRKIVGFLSVLALSAMAFLSSGMPMLGV